MASLLVMLCAPLPSDEVDDEDEDEGHRQEHHGERPEHVVCDGAHGLVAHAHGKDGRERGGGREQAGRHLRCVADDHLECDRLGFLRSFVSVPELVDARVAEAMLRVINPT